MKEGNIGDFLKEHREEKVIEIPKEIAERFHEDIYRKISPLAQRIEEWRRKSLNSDYIFGQTLGYEH